MYKLYYYNLKKIYNKRCQLLYTDTDSLYLNIQTDNVYNDFKKYFSHILDLSNFDKKHFMFSDENRGKLGYLKCETTEPISEFIGLKCKMYAYRIGNTCKKTAKGVKKSALTDITFDTYRNILQSKSLMRSSQYSIISKHHELKTIIQNKISLSAFYLKKYLLDDGINSFSYNNNNINYKY